MLISVTGVAVMQQLKQQSPLDKGDPKQYRLLLLLSPNFSAETLSFFPPLCLHFRHLPRFSWPFTHANRFDGAHELPPPPHTPHPVSATQLFQQALCTGEWCCSLCKCYTLRLIVEPRCHSAAKCQGCWKDCRINNEPFRDSQSTFIFGFSMAKI